MEQEKKVKNLKADTTKTIKEIIRTLIPKSIEESLPENLREKYNALSSSNKDLIYKLCFTQTTTHFANNNNNTQIYYTLSRKYKDKLYKDYLKELRPSKSPRYFSTNL